MQDKIFLTERTELCSGSVLFDRYDKILGVHFYTLWDPEKGEGQDVGEAVAHALMMEAAK